MTDEFNARSLPLLESNSACVEGQTYLIQEVTGYTSAVLSESVERKPGSPTKFHGLYQHAGIVNKNGRCYSEGVLRPEIERLIPIAEARSLVGELDHPADAIIHLADASHVNLAFEWRGDQVFGRGEVLPTPAGKVLDALFDADVRVGISSRGIGGGRHSGGTLHISEGYRCVTFDTVADPSTPDAYQEICEALDLGKRAGRSVARLARALDDGDRSAVAAHADELGISESVIGDVSAEKRRVAPLLTAVLQILANRR